MKKIITILPVFAALVFASSASANNYGSGSYGSGGYGSSSSSSGSYISSINSNNFDPFHKKFTRGASSTASYYYYVGVKAFERNDLQKAERAFNSSLIANGLNEESLLYLAKIAEAKGEMEKAGSYALRYHKLVQGL